MLNRILTVILTVVFLSFSASFAADKPPKKKEPTKKVEAKDKPIKKFHPKRAPTPSNPSTPTTPPPAVPAPINTGSSTSPEEIKFIEATVVGMNLCVACELSAQAGAKSDCDAQGHTPVLHVSKLMDINGLDRPEFLSETLYYLPDEQTKPLVKHLKEIVTIKGKVYPRTHVLEVSSIIWGGNPVEMPDVSTPVLDTGSSSSQPGSSTSPKGSSSSSSPPKEPTPKKK
ncbi:MAG: hypothetical protein V2A61_06185 [Calditrichota bacterium]